MRKNKEYIIDKAKVSLERGDVFVSPWTKVVYEHSIKKHYTFEEEDNRYEMSSVIFVFVRIGVANDKEIRRRTASYNMNVNNKEDWASLLQDEDRLLSYLKDQFGLRKI